MRLSFLLFPLFLGHAHATAQTDEMPFPTRYVCVEARDVGSEDEPKSVLEMLEFVNKQLSAASVLEFQGTTALWDSDFPGLPPLQVLVRHNDVSLMERGYLAAGGPGCDAWREKPFGSCDWSFRGITGSDQSSESVRLVWEFYVLKGSTLSRTKVFSGEPETKVQTYDCTDSDSIDRFMKR